MLADAELVAFVASSDLAGSDAFYAGRLGLRRVDASSYANVYEICGTQLRVTLVDTVAGAPYTVLGWRVADLEATVRSLRKAGIVFNRYGGLRQDEDDAWTAPSGARIVWFTDPDGNTLSLQET